MKRIRPIVKANANLLRKPSIDDEVLRFDGTCETFYLTRKYESDFDFCKTRQDPYDDVVVACLQIAAQEFRDYGFTWSSDGDWPRDHEGGIALLDGPQKELIPPG